MDGSSIVCPHCHREFPLTAAIEQPIVQRLQARFQAESAKREADLKAREEKLAAAQQSVKQEVERQLVQERAKIISEQELKAREAVGVKLQDLERQNSEKDAKLAAAQQQELGLLKRQRELADRQTAFELEKAKQIETERQKIRDDATKAAMETVSTQQRDLRDQLVAKEKLLVQAQEAEIKLRQERAHLEQEKQGFALELARKADEVRDAVKKEKDEEYRLKEAEAAKKLDQMKRQIDDLRRKAEQGSQQTQGEVLEIELESLLRQCFTSDQIVAVPKGVHGGDVLQHVRTEVGQECGTIIWESKRTKVFSDGWIAKLKDDRMAAKAQLAVLVSTVMPKGVATFECREGVWVAPPQLAVPLAAALRLVLVETAGVRRAAEGRQDKMAAMYDYLSGPHFRARIEAIVDAFTTMREDLEDERRAIQKAWAKREKQLDRALVNTAGMYGDLTGIVGKQLPTIQKLELPDGDGEGPPGRPAKQLAL
jgi:hypothetical protein